MEPPRSTDNILTQSVPHDTSPPTTKKSIPPTPLQLTKIPQNPIPAITNSYNEHTAHNHPLLTQNQNLTKQKLGFRKHPPPDINHSP